MVSAVGAGWLGWDHWQNQPVFSQHYATARGESLRVALPDGSEMQLDTATQADVTLYRNRREVRLPEGQVFFQVQPDQGKRFDVLAGSARVSVVGTKFSVRYTPSMQQPTVQVAVLEGHVRVSRADQGADSVQPQVVNLMRGQSVTADAAGNPGNVAAIPAQAIAPWRERRLNFDDVPLSTVLAEIGRYGDVGLQVRDPAVARLPVTVSVDLGKLQTLARVLPLVLPVRLVERDGGTEIVQRTR